MITRHFMSPTFVTSPNFAISSLTNDSRKRPANHSTFTTPRSPRLVLSPCRPRRHSVRASVWTNYLHPPPYTGDAKEDLLIAIKYNDNNGFDKAVASLGPAAANITWGGRRYNQSALLAACFRGRTRMIKELISRGADCTHRNDFGWGAVKYARQYYDVLRLPEGEEVIKLLLERGAADEVDPRRA